MRIALVPDPRVREPHQRVKPKHALHENLQPANPRVAPSPMHELVGRIICSSSAVSRFKKLSGKTIFGAITPISMGLIDCSVAYMAGAVRIANVG